MMDNKCEHQSDAVKYGTYSSSSNAAKPPLGVSPRFIVDEQRQSDLTAAIIRYASAGHFINPEWVAEYNEIATRIQKK